MGVLVSAVSFTLLTSEATTNELRVRGTIARNWRPAYDILVRPANSYTALERTRGLVRANHLSGIFGGITFGDWKDILHTPGVDVAAPIENIGYVLPFELVPVPIDRYLSRAKYQVYRIRQSRLGNGGLSSYPGEVLYVYYTRAHRFQDKAGDPREILPSGASIAVCNGFNYGRPLSAASPFDREFQSKVFCFSSRSPRLAGREYGDPFGRQVGVLGHAYFPLLLAAVDPVQEGKLLNLGRAVISGRGLRERDGPRLVDGVGANGSAVREAPVIASNTFHVDESIQAIVERLAIPSGLKLQRVLASQGARRFLRGLPGRQMGVERLDLQGAYERMLTGASGPSGLATFESYRTVSPVGYRQLSSRILAPLVVQNPDSVWESEQFPRFLTPPTENRDVQFRLLSSRSARSAIVGGIETKPRLRVVGRFDPNRLRGFAPLSTVPLETYYPPVVEPADAASRKALGGHPLMPTMNVGGYVSQPPALLTTLSAARLFTDPSSFTGANGNAPISVIRVRVAGVTGPDPLSRERVRRVAEAIQSKTGLAVDITAGSSLTPVLVRLPRGRFGQPPLLVREGWVKKGVAVQILQAVDRKSVALFVLVLVVTGLFLLNAGLASVRSRRVEIGTLLALGWTRRAIFAATMGESALIGFVAGVVGAGLGAGLAIGAGLRIPLDRVLMICPLAVGLTTLAGIPSAWWASRAAPLDAVRPTDMKRGRPRASRTMLGLALANVRRVRSRTVTAAVGVFIGVAATSMLLAVQFAYRGAVIGTALGAFVSVQVRVVDFVSVALVVCLAAFSVADILALNLKERSLEVVTLRAAGWRTADLWHLVVIEGALVGLLGAAPGAAAGIGFTALVGGHLASLLPAAGLAAASGTAMVILASMVPAHRLARLAPVAILGEE